MSKERKLKQRIAHLEGQLRTIKDKNETLERKGESLNKAIQERLAKDHEIMAEWDKERAGLVKKLTDVRTVVVGTALDEEEQLERGVDLIFADIVGGLHALQLEMQRITATQKTVLSVSQAVACEHSCLQCKGPLPDMEGELTKAQQELMEKRLQAKCEIQKAAKGIALHCPMLNKVDDFITIQKGEADDGGDQEGGDDSGRGEEETGRGPRSGSDGEDSGRHEDAAEEDGGGKQ